MSLLSENVMQCEADFACRFGGGGESACIQDAAYVSSTSPRMIDKIIIAENNFAVEHSALDDAGSLIPCFGSGESGSSRTRKLWVITRLNDV